MNAEQTRIDREIADMREFFKTLTHDKLVNVAVELYRDATANRRQIDDLKGIVR